MLDDLPDLKVLIQVADDSGNALLPGAVEYETHLAAASPARPGCRTRTGDDLYILYTGGTTGMPKGVLWRNADANVECFGGSRADDPRRRSGRGRRAACAPCLPLRSCTARLTG